MLERIPLAYYALAGLINFIASFILAVFVLYKSPKLRVNRIFFVFASAASCWGLFHFLWLRTVDNASLANFYLRTVMLFVIFVPATFTHFILAFLKIDNNKKINAANYLISIILGSTVYTSLFAKDMGAFLVFPFWLKPGPVFHFHLIHFLGNIIYAHILMLRSLKRTSGIFRNQILYVFIGTGIGYTAGVLNYCPWYRIPVPPFLNPLVSIYVAFASYAIIKYRLLDINVALTRAGIFIAVYPLILGIPFWIGFKYLGKGPWILPMSIMAVFATAGPFIYIFLQRRAEKVLLKEDFKKYNTLENFSRTLGITRELELDRLTKLIIYRLVKVMNISYGAIFLLEEEDKFILKASRSLKGVKPAVLELSLDDDFIKFIKFWRKGFMYEDIPKIMEQKASNKNNHQEQCNADLSKVLIQMELLKAKLVIPHFIKDELIGFLILGEKVSSMAYSETDIAKLTTLSSSAGLAITNAISMIKLRDREREFADAARTIEIGNYASGTEHQLGNVLNTIIWACHGLKSDKTIANALQNNPEAISALGKRLEAIITDAQDGGAIIKEIRDYGRQGASKEHKLTNFKEVLDKALRILLIQVNKFQHIDIPIDIAADVPDVLGSPVGLQQVFINMFNNGYDSIQEMKEHINSHPELGITDYKGRIEVRIRRVKGKIEIHIVDNGKGMTEDVARKLFAPRFTTKGSLEKRKEMNLNGGTGIGLFIMRRIIFDHGGTIALSKSEPLRGADFIIQLPVPKQ